jgi:ABC-type amino acid transport substrate-binding protein
VIVSPRHLAVAALVATIVAGCIPQASQPTPTSSARPTSSRPKFELATYMYALQTKGKIRIGVLDAAPPFSTRSSTGTYAGFEPDLGRELAKAIFGPQQTADSVIEWISVDRSTAVSALTSLQADVVVARLASTPDRTAIIDLSDPYFVTGERILIRSTNDEIKDLPDLDTRTVCSLRGTDVAAHVDDMNGFARTLELDSYSACLGALAAGQVDAIAADEATLWDLGRQDPMTKIVGRPLVSERYGIGTKKSVAADRQGFLTFINTWLATAVADGTWARLYARDVAPLSKETKTSPTQ